MRRIAPQGAHWAGTNPFTGKFCGKGHVVPVGAGPGTHKGPPPSLAPPCHYISYGPLAPLSHPACRRLVVGRRSPNVVARGGDVGRWGPCGCQASRRALGAGLLCCLAFALLLLLSPLHASAHIMQPIQLIQAIHLPHLPHTTHPTTTTSLTLQLDVGFNSAYRIGYWTPVRVSLSNTGADFHGTLTIRTASARSRTGGGMDFSPWSFAEPLTLAHGTHKQLTLIVPLYMGPFPPHSIVARLLDSHGQTVVTQEETPNYLLAGDILVGIFSDHSEGFTPLSNVSLPNRYSAIYRAPLDASTMPTTTAALASFDVIVFDDFATSTLSPAQLSALAAWVNQGGTLIESGGPAWQRTLQAFPSALLPIAVHGTSILPAGTHLLPIGSATAQQSTINTLKQSIVVSTATLRTQDTSFESETVLSSGATPLLVQARHGQGMICYLAFDPALPPLADWPAINAFWKSLLVRAVGDQALIPNSPTFSSGPGQILIRGGLVQILQPPPLLSPWIIGLLLLSYIAMIGPIRMLIVRRLKQPQWSWRIMLSSVVIFSLLASGLSLYQHRASLLDNSISIVQLSQGGAPAHITTYHGVFVPSRGDFQLHLPGNSLVLPMPNQLIPGTPIFSADDPQATITPGANGESVAIPDLGTWPYHTLVSEQDRQLQGEIVAHLSLQNNRLVGSVTNTLDASLSNVYVLMPHNVVSIGHLASGETLQINLPLQTAKPGATLADQIAINNGLPASYFPYDQNQQPASELQRHQAILSALGGVGFLFGPCGTACVTQDVVSKGTVIITPPGTPLNSSLPNGRDPLLLNGTAVTLIGWADHPLDAINDITINGSTPYGFHDNLVQVPLSISVAGTVPPNIITGHLVDEQGSDAEAIAPDTYWLSTGFVTFELVLPHSERMRISSLTLTEPNTSGDNNPRTASTNSVIQVDLYNWQAMSWDSIALTSWTFTTTDAASYIGPDGRVLLHIANRNPSGVLVFGKPSLSVKAVWSSKSWLPARQP